MRHNKRVILFVVASLLIGLLIAGSVAAIASAKTPAGSANQQPAVQQTQTGPAQTGQTDQEKPGGQEVNNAKETDGPGGHEDPAGTAADHQYEGVE